MLLKTISLLTILLQLAVSQLYFGEISEVTRQVNLQDRYVETDIVLTYKNNGNQAIYNFFYAIPNNLNSTLVHVLVDNNNGTYSELESVQDSLYTSGVSYSVYKYPLPKRVLPQDSVEIKLRELFIHRMDPIPKSIGLREHQLVFYSDNKYFYSPYKVLKQRTNYNTGNLKQYSPDEDKVLKRQNSVKYGNYLDIAPFSFEEIQLHFENDTPLAIFKKVTKNIEVSHWGNIAIDSNFQVVNNGAELKGEFDRLSRQFTNVAKSALKGLHAELPYHAWGVSYFDEIGNISTSNAFRDQENKVVSLDIRHRFPILGGWKSNFNVGYNLNTSRYIYDKGDNEYILKQLFSYPFLDLVAEDFELSVSLPQGAYDVDVVLPFGVDDKVDEITNSYLDTKGRTTIKFNKKMISAYHNQFFYVHYKLDQIEMYRKPVILFMAFFAFFVFLVIINRLDSDKRNNAKKDQ